MIIIPDNYIGINIQTSEQTIMFPTHVLKENFSKTLKKMFHSAKV